MESEGKYSAATVAKWLISKDKTISKDIMKILKLVYISHGFFLAYTGEPLIKESVQAWQYGPVIPELYFRLKTQHLGYNAEEENTLATDEFTQALLTAVYKKYSVYNGGELSSLTHQVGTPWDITVSDYKALIDNELIKSYYRKLLGE